MKKKIQKKIFLIGLLIPIFSMTIVVSSFIYNRESKIETINSTKDNLNNSILLNSNEDISSSLYSLGTVTETASTFSFKALDDILPSIKEKKADKVSAEEIASILIPSNLDAIFHVEILSIDLPNGIVTFELLQNLKTFTDGKVTSTSNQKIPQTVGGIDTSWKTPVGLLLTDKYNFSWRTDREIGFFIDNTILKPNELTKEIVVNELVRLDGAFKLPDLANISIDVSDVSTNSMSLYGVAKLVINFANTPADSWDNNAIPSLANRTIILRGMNNSLNQKSAMVFSELKNSQDIGSIVITDKNIFGDFLLDNENKISDLYPSEFVSLNSSNLINMFQKGTYLEMSTKLIDLNYMGLSISDTNFANITGFSANDVSQLGLSEIISEPNDLDGSLKLIYKYKSFDIKSNDFIDYTISQIFAPKTFKINPDINKSLVFNWKSNSDVQELGSSYELVNSFHKTFDNSNLTNEEKKAFLINYSNLFFNGSKDSYEKSDRNFTIDYKGGTKLVNGEYIPVSTTPSDFNQLEIIITFDSWSGHIYTETTGGIATKKDGLKQSITYSMPIYKYSSSSISWRDNQSVADLYSKLPSEIAYDISTNVISTDRFFTITGLNSVQVIILPNDLLGSLNIKIIGTAQSNQVVYQNVFTGFKLNNIGGEILQFGWLPQIELPQSITNQPIDLVKDADIIAYITANIPLLQSGVINDNDISIIREKNAIYVRITFDFFNQELAAPGNQVFMTKLVGFKEFLPGNEIFEQKEPINLTLIISVALASIIGIPLLVFLIILLVKYIKYSKNKKLASNKPGKGR